MLDNMIKVCVIYTILVIVQITSNPISVIAYENTPASLICEAEGSGPILYHWRKVNGRIDDCRTKGINTSVLTIYPVFEQDKGEYYCVVSNEGADGKIY